MLTGNKNLDFKILNELDDVDLVNLCQTNHQANELCNNQTFWFNMILNRFPYLDLNILKQYKQERSWSQYYIEDLRQVTPTNAQNKLERSSENGRLDLIIIAVNKGPDIRANNDIAVRWASQDGHLEVVKYLVSQGAGIRAPCFYQINDEPVRLASENGHLEVVKYLVSQGANIRAADDEAVKLAYEYGHSEVVKYLVSQGAPTRFNNLLTVP